MAIKDKMKILLKALLPIILGVIIALIPPPQGLSMNAWLYFALFVAVIVGVILELPPFWRLTPCFLRSLHIKAFNAIIWFYVIEDKWLA